MKIIELTDNDVPGEIYKIYIGQNQHENDQLLKSARQNDIWMHIENISGPHIIIQTDGRLIPKNILYKAAEYFKVYKNNLPSSFYVIYTERRNVTCTKTPGLVNTKRTKKLKI